MTTTNDSDTFVRNAQHYTIGTINGIVETVLPGCNRALIQCVSEYFISSVLMNSCIRGIIASDARPHARAQARWIIVADLMERNISFLSRERERECREYRFIQQRLFTTRK